MSFKKYCVVVPTYNEKENLKELLPELLKLSARFDILVVDDSSPDGTADFVHEFRSSSEDAKSRIHVLSRGDKDGLGRAYIAGFKWCLERNYDFISQMDADFSHRPHDLQQILKVLPDHDFIIGSRYVVGGRVENWGLIRKLISRGGSLYSRLILGYPVRDWTGGFNHWKAQVLKDIDLDAVRSNGYSFQIELKYKAQVKGYKPKEFPIVFADRRVGESKMSMKIVIEAFYKVWLIRF